MREYITLVTPDSSCEKENMARVVAVMIARSSPQAYSSHCKNYWFCRLKEKGKERKTQEQTKKKKKRKRTGKKGQQLTKRPRNSSDCSSQTLFFKKYTGRELIHTFEFHTHFNTVSCPCRADAVYIVSGFKSHLILSHRFHELSAFLLMADRFLLLQQR